MKKFFLSLMTLLLALTLCLGAQAEAIDYTGEWTCTGVGMAGMQYDPSALGLSMTMTLNADGTCVMTTLGVEETGVWAVTETGLTLTQTDEGATGTEDDVMDMVYDAAADSLSAEQDGMQVIFTRTASGISVRANVPLTDFIDTWKFEHVEISDGQYFLPEDLAIDYLLTITEEGGSLTVTSEGETETYSIYHELSEEDGLGTLLYALVLNPDNAEEYIAEMPLLLYEDDQLVWYSYEEENELEVFYCFDRLSAFSQKAE